MTINMILLILVSVTNGFHDLSVTLIDGKLIPLTSLKGNTTVVGIVDQKSPNNSIVKFLDSLQTSRQNINVILVPATDFPNNKNDEVFVNLIKQTKSRMLVLQPSQIMATAKQRSELVSWLTDVGKNKHFQIDELTEGFVFVVNGSGEMLSALANGFPMSTLNDALK